MHHCLNLLYSICLIFLPIGKCPIASADEFQDSVAPLLRTHCLECHGADTQESRIRFDRLDSFNDKDSHLWTKVHEVLSAGEMPPEGHPQPDKASKEKIYSWIIAQQQTMDVGITRRLNRREISAALQDLTGLPIDFAAGLPGDGKIDGFDTGAAGLKDASDSVAQFLEVTRRVVESIRFLEPPRDNKIHINFLNKDFNDFRKFVEQHWKDSGIFTRSKRLLCKQGIGLYLPTQWTGDRGNSFLAVPAPADKRAMLKMTLRVKSIRPLQGLPVPMLWVKIGGKYIDYRPVDEQSQNLTYFVRMEDHLVENGVIKVMLQSFVEIPYTTEGFENDDRSKPEDKIPGGIGVYRPKFDRKKLRTPDVQPVPSIIIESIEIDYDHVATWPPASWNLDSVATDPARVTDAEKNARRLLSIWMQRAWRRPVTKAETDTFFELYRKLRGQGLSFDDALRAAFQSVLMGGPFRYLASTSDKDPIISQHAIASRLSFMLIGSPPDDELRRLAAAQKLRNPDVLDTQVERLLNDPRSRDFYHPFVTQWLNMDQPITFSMSHIKKQDFRFGRHLKASMKEETIQYIQRLFTDNRPARELVASDWTMMNDVLAWHYDYPPLDGQQLRKVQLQKNDSRGGGILGHAGIQSMLCWMGDNWVIYRGAWTLNHILDDPPPTPPLEIPELNPSDKSNRGKRFRELLSQHQADKNCAICHKKMDSLGFAFQNFGLSGRWLSVEHERYHRSELDGKVEWRGEGKTRPVDTTGTLPRGEQFATFGEFKEQLVENYMDDVVRGLLKKLTLYGTGSKPDVLDLATIRLIMDNHSPNHYRLQDILKALIKSEIFLGPSIYASGTKK